MKEIVTGFFQRRRLRAEEEIRQSKLKNELDAESSRLNIDGILKGIQRDVWGGGSIGSPSYTFSLSGGERSTHLTVVQNVNYPGYYEEVDTMPGAGYWVGDRFQTVYVPERNQLEVLETLCIAIEVDNIGKTRRLLLNPGSDYDSDRLKPRKEFLLDGSKDDLRRLKTLLHEDLEYRLSVKLLPLSEPIKSLKQNQ